MPATGDDSGAGAADIWPVGLILLDVINDLEWEGGELLLPHFDEASKQIATLAERARHARIPVLYVNDNYGKWQSDFARLVAHCTEDGVRGAEVVRRLRPHPDDYFVLKPKHSGCFSTTLETLLRYLGARTLILAGVAGNICVLFTAADAHMRDFRLIVPADCIASNTGADNAHAVDLMARVFGADTRPSTDLDLELLLRGSVPDVH